MTDQPIKEDQVQVAVQTLKEGSITIGTKQAFMSAAPDKLKRVLTAIRYTLTGLIVTVSATDLFTPYQSKVTTFVLSFCILLCGGVELGVGVKPLPEEKS